MRIALALALAGAVAVCATAAYGRGAARGTAGGFRPETAAAVGTQNLWVLGDQTLLRSTDGGKHFERVGLPQFSSQGTVPTIDFANARDGFAYVEDETPLYVTHDGGKTWRRAGPVRNVAAFASGGGYAYVAAGDVLERSSVGRSAWRRLTAFVWRLRVSLAARGSSVWLLGPPRRRPDFDTIALSSDRGRTFTTRRGPCLNDLGGALAPAAHGAVWAVCPSGMMAWLSRSSNGGRSFSVRSYHDPGGLHGPSLTNGGRIAAASARVAVLSGGGDGALLRTTDAGRHWSPVPRTADIEQVLSLGFSTSRVGFALVETHFRTQLWRTTDSGATWRSMSIR